MSDKQVLPEGIVVQHTLHGEPAGLITHAWTAGEVRHVPYDGVPYVDPAKPEPVPVASTPPDDTPVERPEARLGMCRAKDDTCKAHVVAGSEFCIFHGGKKVT